MSLHACQTELADILLAEDTQTDCVQPSAHLAIYRHTFITNLTQSLQTIYPLITRLVGEEFFLATAQEYRQSYPSRSGNLHDYGEYFSDFLVHYAPVNHLPYLSEVALFEWISYQLSFAAEPSAFDWQQLKTYSQTDYQQLHFSLHPACRLITFHYPLLDILALCKGEIEELRLNENTPNDLHLLMIRKDMEIVLYLLPLADYTFLLCLQDNQSLAQATEAALSIQADFELEKKLSQWTKDKIIVSVTTDY